MNDDAGQQLPTTVGSEYARGLLATAFVTAVTHRDAATRNRAESRIRKWWRVLDGLTDGTLRIGSRTPTDFPAWVTLDVVRGGFATGRASAGGALEPYEIAAARRAAVPERRAALFAHSLTAAGMAELDALLDSGRYEVTIPEESALLTVAWLVRVGDVRGAAELVDTLEPFADQLRFTPRPTERPVPDTDTTHRHTVSDVTRTLAARTPNRAVETQREALTVWQPFADELLAHWLRVRVLEQAPDGPWLEDAARLLTRYRALATAHRLCGKHRDPKENLAILHDALADVVAGRTLDPRQLGLLRHAVASMVRRRGLPGSAAHTALRRAQSEQTARPSYHALAALLLRRLSELPQQVGVRDIAPLLAPVDESESSVSGIPAGVRFPTTLRRVVESALSAPLGTLIERGVIPSAEVLAELVPQLVAATTAAAYPDAAARTLVAAAYRAFRNRRSLLLLNLQHQVRVEELPWMRALAAHRTDAAPVRSALRELGELAIQGFPGTILPNPLVRELDVLARHTGLRAPLVEELAADIFMGTFTPKFLDAAVIASELLGDTLYERYYGIDYAELGALATRANGAAEFARLCAERAGGSGSSVAANGKVIEQAQILTTHNLATLVHVIGIAPTPGWAESARRCFRTVCVLTARVHNNPRPLATIKDAAYAWRQMIFHLSLCAPEERDTIVRGLASSALEHPAHVAARLAPALNGLRLVADGGTFDRTGSADTGRSRRFLGWTTEPHWLRPNPFARR